MWPRSIPWPAILVALLALVRQCDPTVPARSASPARSQQRGSGEAPLVAAVIAALDRMVTYYEVNHQQLNLDAIFGAKAIEGEYYYHYYYHYGKSY